MGNDVFDQKKQLHIKNEIKKDALHRSIKFETDRNEVNDDVVPKSKTDLPDSLIGHTSDFKSLFPNIDVGVIKQRMEEVVEEQK